MSPSGRSATPLVMMLRRVMALAREDLRLTLRERSSLFWIFIAPFLWVAFFGTFNRPQDPSQLKIALSGLDYLARRKEGGVELGVNGFAGKKEQRRIGGFARNDIFMGNVPDMLPDGLGEFAARSGQSRFIASLA